MSTQRQKRDGSEIIIIIIGNGYIAILKKGSHKIKMERIVMILSTHMYESFVIELEFFS